MFGNDREGTVHRILLLFCLIVAAPPVWAAGSTVTASDATSGPNANSPPLQPAQTGTPPPEAAQPSEACPPRPPLAEGAPSDIVVALDPDTLWRPRGGEVRFTIRNPAGSVTVSHVRVCFGWSSADGAFRKSQTLLASPEVRSVSTDSGTIEYGALVPFLRRIPNSEWWPRRIVSDGPYVFSGGFTVPVADMVVQVTTASGQVVLTAVQVGVTDVAVAWLVVAAVQALLWLMIDRIARYRQVRGRTLMLKIISTRDGYASLSQFQIVLWTVVVGMSAIYVMTLSGNLISISNGTLILLGIASGTALAARLPGLQQQAASAPAPAPDAATPEPATPAAATAAPAIPAPATPDAATPEPGSAEATPATPEWSDLIIPDRSSQEIDVTRVQMLAFTLITSAFVLIKVIVDYEIPEIPPNFLVLMGISNGVYVGGRRLPSQPKNGGSAP